MLVQNAHRCGEKAGSFQKVLQAGSCWVRPSASLSQQLRLVAVHFARRRRDPFSQSEKRAATSGPLVPRDESVPRTRSHSVEKCAGQPPGFMKNFRGNFSAIGNCACNLQYKKNKKRLRAATSPYSAFGRMGPFLPCKKLVFFAAPSGLASFPLASGSASFSPFTSFLER